MFSVYFSGHFRILPRVAMADDGNSEVIEIDIAEWKKMKVSCKHGQEHENLVAERFTDKAII